jgi:ectoine hydrolase
VSTQHLCYVVIALCPTHNFFFICSPVYLLYPAIPQPDKFDIEMFAHLTSKLALLAKEHGLSLGANWGNPQVLIGTSPAVAEDAANGSPVSLVSAALLVNWVRAVKSEREVAALRIAARIADSVMRAAIATVTAGGLQNATAGAASNAQARGVLLEMPDGELLACGGDASAVWPTIATGIDATAAHLPWSRSGRYRAGTGTFLELSGVYKRYTCPIARSCFVVDPASDSSKPGAEQARKLQFETLHAITAEALGAAIGLCREGQSAASVYAVFNEVLAKHGQPPKLSRLG